MFYKSLIAAFILIIIASASWYFLAQDISSSPQINQPQQTKSTSMPKRQIRNELLTAIPNKPFAPTFELPDDNGEMHSLSEYRGKPIIINFWATWCPPCRAELPSMNRAWRKIKDEGIQMIAINVGEDEDTVFAFKGEYPIDFQVLIDQSGEMVSEWPIKGLPTTFVIDKEGRLVYLATGEREWDSDELLDKVRELNQ